MRSDTVFLYFSEYKMNDIETINDPDGSNERTKIKRYRHKRKDTSYKIITKKQPFYKERQ